jgi:ABC-type polysaccharide/polyol phosphate export permease
MEVFRSLLQHVKENILYNPITWIIAAVVLWIIGAAFLKAWRGKDDEE